MKEGVIKNLGRKDVLAAGLFGSLARGDFNERRLWQSARVLHESFYENWFSPQTVKENTNLMEPKIGESAKAYLRRGI